MTLSERLSLEEIIAGLADDLVALRAGRITTGEAKARAALAHEIMRGVNLVVKAGALFEARAKQIGGR
jgi:hypothetical protein